MHDLVLADGLRPVKIAGYTHDQLVQHKLYNALDAGPFNITVSRRTWEFPTVRTCSCCGASHYFDLARYYLIRHFGPPGICAPCMLTTRFGLNAYEFNRSEILSAFRAFADATDTIPSSNFHENLYTSAMSDVDRGIVVALLMSIPGSR